MILINSDNTQVWEKQGYYTSLAGVLFSALLPPFQTKQFASGSVTVAEWKLRKLRIRGTDKTIVKETDLSTGEVDKYSGTTYDRFYYTAQDEQDTYNAGVYEYYLKDSDDNEWISEVFKYCPGAVTEVDGDFNNDFNDDFS